MGQTQRRPPGVEECGLKRFLVAEIRIVCSGRGRGARGAPGCGRIAGQVDFCDPVGEMIGGGPGLLRVAALISKWKCNTVHCRFFECVMQGPFAMGLWSFGLLLEQNERLWD